VLAWLYLSFDPSDMLVMGEIRFYDILATILLFSKSINSLFEALVHFPLDYFLFHAAAL
jgi:hypothetical protein